MRTAARTEPVGEALEVDLINLIEDRHHGLLDDFIFQCRDAQRTLPPIGLRYKDSSSRLGPERSAVNPAWTIIEATFQSRFILLPSDTIDSRRSLTLESVEAIAQQRGVNVVEQGSEPFLFLFPCCFSHTVQSLGHAVPALCWEHA